MSKSILGADWSARDWSCDFARAVVDRDTTDEQLSKYTEDLEDAAEADGVAIHGDIYKALERFREDARTEIPACNDATMKTNEFFYTDKQTADHASVILEGKGYETGVSRVPCHSEFKLTTNANRETVVAVNTEITEQF